MGNNRNQPTFLRTGLLGNMVLLVLVCLALCYVIGYYSSAGKAGAAFGFYVPPARDKTALLGVPSQNVTEGFDYVTVEIASGLAFKMASNLYMQHDGTITILLTNPGDSGVYLLYEIKEMATGRTLAKSGRIAPGHYVERIKQKRNWKNEEKDICVSIYAIDPIKHYSRGTVEFETTLYPW